MSVKSVDVNPEAASYTITFTANGPTNNPDTDNFYDLSFIWRLPGQDNDELHILWGWYMTAVAYWTAGDSELRCANSGNPVVDGNVEPCTNTALVASTSGDVVVTVTPETGLIVITSDGKSVFNRVIPAIIGADRFIASLATGTLTTPTYDEELNGLPWWAWLLIGIGIFLVVVGLGYALYSNSKKKTPPAPPPAATGKTVVVNTGAPPPRPPPPNPYAVAPYPPQQGYGAGGYPAPYPPPGIYGPPPPGMAYPGYPAPGQIMM